ncbi:MAG: alpha/beta fold hydrolase [Thermoanaerobacteraceae bacterium]|nr:alpha/beta fold hydrolase [Thermoanaerobacteraceae bacterium]
MQQVYFHNSRRQQLCGLFYPAASQNGLAVNICHGFRGSKEGSGRGTEFAKILSDEGYPTLLFDFSGTGESEGDFADTTLTNYIDDLGAALDCLEQQGYKRFIIIGRSFGGTTALCRAARDSRIKGICTWGTPWNLEDTFREGMGTYWEQLKKGKPIHVTDEFGTLSLKPGFYQDIIKYDVLKIVAALPPIPLFFIHGTNDELVNVSQAKELYRAAKEPKDILFIEGSDHRFLQHQEQLRAATLRWLQQVT